VPLSNKSFNSLLSFLKKSIQPLLIGLLLPVFLFLPARAQALTLNIAVNQAKLNFPDRHPVCVELHQSNHHPKGFF